MKRFRKSTARWPLACLLLWPPALSPAAAEAEAPEFSQHHFSVKGGYLLFSDRNEMVAASLAPADFSGLLLAAGYDYRAAEIFSFGAEFFALRQREPYPLQDRSYDARLAANGLLLTTRFHSAPSPSLDAAVGPGIGLYSVAMRYDAVDAPQEGARVVPIEEDALAFGLHLSAGVDWLLNPSFSLGSEARVAWMEPHLGEAGTVRLLHGALMMAAGWNF